MAKRAAAKAAQRTPGEKMKERRATTAENKGISIGSVYLVTLILAGLLAAFTLILAGQTNRSYRSMQNASKAYIAGRQDAADMMDASDYLTEMVREFVITDNPDCVTNFFVETEQTRRRDLALEDLGRSFSGTEGYGFLLSALERSNALTETEKYAMRLKVESLGQDPADYPAGIGEITLSASDAALSSDEKALLAVELVFGEAYQARKDEIRADVEKCLETLLRSLEDAQSASTARYLSALRVQTALVIALFAVLFAAIYLSYRLVIRPLLKSVGHMGRNEKMVPKGSREMRFLADTYNGMFEQTRRDAEQLSYDASHDDLTDLYNRGVFERLRKEHDDGTEAMLLIDIDKFKTINDIYGHDVGDRALKKVASLLKASFRSEDYVCRIGGDEFAVIMLHASSALRELVEGKVRRLNDALSVPEEGLPAISLSVGVAFGDRENATDDIFKDADSALYRVKNAGGRGCGFY